MQAQSHLILQQILLLLGLIKNTTLNQSGGLDEKFSKGGDAIYYNYNINFSLF